MQTNKNNSEEETKFEGEIEYIIKVKVEGKKPEITKVKKIVEDGLFDEYHELYRVTHIFDDTEDEDDDQVDLDELKEKLGISDGNVSDK